MWNFWVLPFIWFVVQLTAAKHCWCCFTCSQSSQCFVGAEWCLSVLVTNECGPSHCWQPPQSCDAIFSSSAGFYNYYCLSGPRASNTSLHSGTWDTHTHTPSNTLHTSINLWKQAHRQLNTCIHSCRHKTQRYIVYAQKNPPSLTQKI